MKKSLLLILASLFAIFALAGCAEEEKNDTPAPTVDPALVEQIKQFAEGYYEITFFYTDGAGTMPFSSDCTQAGNYGITAPDTCQTATTKGYGQITVDDSGNMKLITKIQMSNQIMAKLSPDSQYNYTEYPLLPASSIDMTGMTQGVVTINSDKAIIGTTGRDLTKNTSDSAATYTFVFDMQTGTVTNTMTVTTPPSPIPGVTLNPITNVSIVMKKTQALLDGYTMDKNTAFPEPAIEGFVTTPAN